MENAISNVNLLSSKDSDETCNMHAKSDNIEIMMGSETNNTIYELFESLFQKHQEGLEESIKGHKLIFDSVDILYYNLQKINLNRKGSTYIEIKKQQ